MQIPPPGELGRVVVVASRHKPQAHACARELAGWFRERGADVVLDLTSDAGLHEQARGRDLLVCVGGDGTILGVARALRGLPIPTLGINIGKLGFLAEFTAEDIRAYLDGGPAPFRIVPRLMLLCRVDGGEPSYALNDVVLTQGPMTRVLEIAMEVDGRQATRYYADGVIVSTPVGSTAYSLSVGGPILTPNMDAFVVTPLAPHALTNRPLVIEGGSRLSFRVLRAAPPSLSVVFDGQDLKPLGKGEALTIERAPSPFLLAAHTGRSHFDILRRKLHWAVRPTGAAPAPQVVERLGKELPLAVVYLHGFASSPRGRKAEHLVSRLRERGLVVEAPDLNEGPGGFAGLTISRMLEATGEACTRVRRLAGLSPAAPVVLIGSSLGAYVAALFAADASHSVGGLVLLAPAFDFADNLRRRLTPAQRQRLEASGALEVEHFGTGRTERVGRGLFDDAAGHPAFPDVGCPALVMHGRNDESVPVELSQRFAQGRANVQLLLLEDDHRLSGSLEAVASYTDHFIDALAPNG